MKEMNNKIKRFGRLAFAKIHFTFIELKEPFNKGLILFLLICLLHEQLRDLGTYIRNVIKFKVSYQRIIEYWGAITLTF